MISGLQTSRSSKIGSFNGDFDELASLIERSWSENKEQPLRYTSGFLRSAFQYPGSNFELAPAIYRDGKLLAFIAGFPRTVRISGNIRKLISVSLLTVSPERKRCGYGPLLWGELMKRAREFAYDGALDFCVAKDEWNRQILKVARAFRQPTLRIIEVSFVARLVKDRGTASDDVARAGNNDSKMLMEAASQLANSLPLSRLWSPDEAEWQCRLRQGALTATLAVAGSHGVLNGYTMEISGAVPTVGIILDNILWGQLGPSHCAELTRLFVSRAEEAHAQVIIAPVLGYADIQPLEANGFRKTRRLLQGYLTLWTEPRVTDNLSPIYMDVF